ncbi:MAG: hypothetical protein QOH95_1083, partial [Gaiellaceae bacterium]|nr:hypothetical protein [Gaiellaceae bacterium]
MRFSLLHSRAEDSRAEHSPAEHSPAEHSRAVRAIPALSLAGLAVLVTFALAGAAFAREGARPDSPVPVGSLRTFV